MLDALWILQKSFSACPWRDDVLSIYRFHAYNSLLRSRYNFEFSINPFHPFWNNDFFCAICENVMHWRNVFSKRVSKYFVVVVCVCVYIYVYKYCESNRIYDHNGTHLNFSNFKFINRI